MLFVARLDQIGNDTADDQNRFQTLAQEDDERLYERGSRRAGAVGSLHACHLLELRLIVTGDLGIIGGKLFIGLIFFDKSGRYVRELQRVLIQIGSQPLARLVIIR